MKHSLKAIFAAALGGAAGLAQAHEGHGLPGVSHWHAGDTFGYVVLAAVVAAALWSTRRK
ncbi:hypothetical protein [Azohydromonas aeria]|uniref:hypothetical protein n=1 Tax=Azohydromonas aeria TaxID=2590212 RepID=UPI0012F7276F|nr:hypothetical protein [Azohydromonas aeria]